MRNVLVFICRLGIYLFLRLHLYRVKSWLYRWAAEKKYRDYPVSTYTSLPELVTFIRTLVWVADDWRQLWDAISYPGKVECIGKEGDKRVGDCDEFAVYNAAAIQKSLTAGHPLDVANPRLMTVTWLREDGLPGGHNVCCFEMRSPGPPLGYMDYSMPLTYNTWQAMVNGIIRRYGKDGAVCLGWAISDPVTLAPLEVHWS